jgi:hypothetical protein
MMKPICMRVCQVMRSSCIVAGLVVAACGGTTRDGPSRLHDGGGKEARAHEEAGASAGGGGASRANGGASTGGAATGGSMIGGSSGTRIGAGGVFAGGSGGRGSGAGGTSSGGAAVTPETDGQTCLLEGSSCVRGSECCYGDCSAYRFAGDGGPIGPLVCQRSGCSHFGGPCENVVNCCLGAIATCSGITGTCGEDHGR